MGVAVHNNSLHLANYAYLEIISSVASAGIVDIQALLLSDCVTHLYADKCKGKTSWLEIA
jgi:hypothetical protein